MHGDPDPAGQVRSPKYKAPVVDDGIDSEDDGPGDFEPDGKTKPRDFIHMNGNEGKNEFSTSLVQRRDRKFELAESGPEVSQ